MFFIFVYIQGAEQSGCRFRGGWYASEKGCQADCQFTEVTRACCQGYYGSSCQGNKQ